MNRHHDELKIDPSALDLVTIERQARALRARVLAEASRAAWNWIAARLRRNPAGQTV